MPNTTKDFIGIKQDIALFIKKAHSLQKNKKLDQTFSQREIKFLNNLTDTIVALEKQVNKRLANFYQTEGDDLSQALEKFKFENEFCNKFVIQLTGAIQNELATEENKNRAYYKLLENLLSDLHEIHQVNLRSIHQLDRIIPLTSSFIYTYCEFFNGRFKYFQQGFHPLTGLTKGNCVGFIYAFADEKRTEKSTFFNYDEEIAELQKIQDPTFAFKQEHLLIQNAAKSILNSMDVNTTHYISIAPKTSFFEISKGHALAIKRLGIHGVELNDPNFGIFTFKSQDDFIRWFPFLILSYVANFHFTRFQIIEIARSTSRKEHNIDSTPIKRQYTAKEIKNKFSLLFETTEKLYNSIYTKRESGYSILDLQFSFYEAFRGLIDIIDDKSVLNELEKRLKNTISSFYTVSQDEIMRKEKIEQSEFSSKYPKQTLHQLCENAMKEKKDLLANKNYNPSFSYGSSENNPNDETASIKKTT